MAVTLVGLIHIKTEHLQNWQTFLHRQHGLLFMCIHVTLFQTGWMWGRMGGCSEIRETRSKDDEALPSVAANYPWQTGGDASSRHPRCNKGPRGRLSVRDRWVRVVARGVSLRLHDRLAHMVTNKGWLRVRNPRVCLGFWGVQSVFEYLKCEWWNISIEYECRTYIIWWQSI